MNLSFQKLFYALATVFALFAILILAKSILIPLGFALFMSFILFPLTKRFESWGMNKIFAAFLSVLTVILIIGGGISLFSTQLIELSKELSDFQDRIIRAFADVTLYINKNVNIISDLGKNELSDKIKDWLNESKGSLVSKTFTTTTTFLAGLFGTIIFTFLILIYRHGLTQALISFSPEDKRERVVKMFKSVQQVGQKYLSGMILLIIIIGLANSLGLWIIGIDNPFLFGFLAAVLSIVPYIGTAFGAIIPILYAFVSYDSLWPVIAVAVLFWAVQLISDNFLSPKIVGGSLHINAIVAILSLIIGALVWGVAGMILFLPFAAMLKVFCEEYEELKPIALLIGDQNYKEKNSGGKFIKSRFARIQGWFPKFHSGIKKNSGAKHSDKSVK
ncbi:MAG: AI-2E family transporter [Bacteroidales bacterium]|nr:AI-2E family transporter [Bacteroidales bacterium]